MIEVYTGRPGSGKSNKLAQTLIEIIGRNQRFYLKTGIVRHIYTNFRLRDDLEEKFSGALRHWNNLEELAIVQDSDVFIDEIFNYFDAKHWAELSFSIRRWLSQHRKMGVEIYGNSQDFAQIDIAFRRMVSKLYYLVKIISSRDPSPTRPPVKFIWGLSVIYTLSPIDYKEDQKENKTVLNGIMFITRRTCEIYNTREIIEPGVFPPFVHTERYCNKPNCEFKRILHN
jgi:hypothetical protein